MPATELFTQKETAKYRRCSGRKLDRERAEGRGPAYVRIDGRIFYRREDLDRFIAAHVCGGEARGMGDSPAAHPGSRLHKNAEAALISNDVDHRISTHARGGEIRGEDVEPAAHQRDRKRKNAKAAVIS